MSNRKHNNLTYIFEVTCAISICPALNVTQNPTSEWETKFYGWQLLMDKHEIQLSATCDAQHIIFIIIIDYAC